MQPAQSDHSKSCLSALDRRLSVAPMMECTDRHDRYLLRLISKHVLLYTEMVVTAALIHGDRRRFLHHDAFEHPVALQLGGSDPAELAICARMGVDDGYSEINLNVGCPSDRVQSGSFGACLMLEPGLVRDCVAAMVDVVDVPVTVKCRIGVDEHDSWDELVHFVHTVAAGGCSIFIIHARKALLSGLSPKQNREIPPLNYDTVYRLRKEFPGIGFVLNGGVQTMDAAVAELGKTDGVMIGRAAYSNPYMLVEADARIFGATAKQPTREDIVDAYCGYMSREIAQGTYLKHMSRHLLGLYQGQPGARAWRRTLSELGPRKDAGLEVIDAALQHVQSRPTGVIDRPDIGAERQRADRV